MIRGGREGYDRLLLLARASWPATAALFGRAGIRAGMQGVDLGCGGGEVTFELARLAGGGGSVTGVDMDEVKLGLAQKPAHDRGVRRPVKTTGTRPHSDLGNLTPGLARCGE